MKEAFDQEKVSRLIRNVIDFPKKGINFKDITPLLQDPGICEEVLSELSDRVKELKPDVIASVESRGFLFGMLLANKLGLPFVPIRKSGKLPYHKISYVYNLEYGSATMEMHNDAIKPGQRVLLHDDLLATGGTMEAAASLVNELGGKVAGFAFLISLDFLSGKSNLEKYSDKIISLIQYKN